MYRGSGITEWARGTTKDEMSARLKRAEAEMTMAVNRMVRQSHGNSVSSGWYSDPQTGEPIPRNVGEMMALMHSEISEALEGYRKNTMDDHLPHRRAVEVELADLLHRLCDLAGYLGVDLGAAYVEKGLYNLRRKDHTPEARREANGKQF